MDDRNDNLILLPVLPLRGLVVFPKALIHFDVGRKKSISAINAAMKNDQLIFSCYTERRCRKRPGYYKMLLNRRSCKK